ncbi:hypothetical protein B0H63DRAFT_506793 [Podospora didyma]|uniref:Uncharacterized protein n=1 Tax=Podospora didyma TaxID=330526 RepID=A0AAE0U9A0_9PEZI|nr:hypothetical protein B0H63DRAFT_506793 [Podospora didyma]
MGLLSAFYDYTYHDGYVTRKRASGHDGRHENRHHSHHSSHRESARRHDRPAVSRGTSGASSSSDYSVHNSISHNRDSTISLRQGALDPPTYHAPVYNPPTYNAPAYNYAPTNHAPTYDAPRLTFESGYSTPSFSTASGLDLRGYGLPITGGSQLRSLGHGRYDEPAAYGGSSNYRSGNYGGYNYGGASGGYGGVSNAPNSRDDAEGDDGLDHFEVEVAIRRRGNDEAIYGESFGYY